MAQLVESSENRKAGDGLKVLVIDDESFHAETVAESLERVGYDCVVATSGAAGAKKIEQDEFDVIVTDLKMADLDGLAILRKAREELPEAEVIMITGHGDVKTAVEAIKEGAANYLAKPVDLVELRAIVDKAGERLRLAKLNRELKRQLDEKFGFEGVIGNSPAMHHVIKACQAIAPTNATVLVLGETGTGKELIARAIHNNSPRKNKPFAPLNCTAFNENLLDDELFGHEVGAFTGADKMRKGRFEYANVGTLFLDEIGDMSTPLQTRLLRVLAEGEFYRVGGQTPIRVDVRVIAATHQNLQERVAQGSFREDLYHRLNVIRLALPALRERAEDIPLLLRHYLRTAARDLGVEAKALAPQAEQRLLAYRWPGNVRELVNICRRLSVLAPGREIGAEDLPMEIGVAASDPPGEWQSALAEWAARQAASGELALLDVALPQFERVLICAALKRTQGHRQEAARLLGWGRNTLTRKLKELRLDIPPTDAGQSGEESL